VLPNNSLDGAVASSSLLALLSNATLGNNRRGVPGCMEVVVCGGDCWRGVPGNGVRCGEVLVCPWPAGGWQVSPPSAETRGEGGQG